MFKKISIFLLCLSLHAQENLSWFGAKKQEIAAPPSSENPIVKEVEAVEAKSYWKYHQWASVGYRRDRQKFQETNTIANYTERNTLQLTLGSHLEWQEVVGYFRGSYGWLANGNLNFTAPGSRFSEPLSFDEYDLGAGYTVDVLMAIGYRLKLYNCPQFGVSLIPAGGYKYSHVMNFPKGENRFIVPNPPALLIPGNTGFALARFPNPNQQDWFGPFAEGRLEFRFWELCEWSLFYQYHWTTVRSTSKEEIDLYLFNPATTATAIDLFRTNSIYKASFAHKQVGGMDFRYRSPKAWNFGIHFQGATTWTHKAEYDSKRTREQYILAPTGVTTSLFNEPASIHWVCYEVSLSLGYQF